MARLIGLQAQAQPGMDRADRTDAQVKAMTAAKTTGEPSTKARLLESAVDALTAAGNIEHFDEREKIGA